MTAIPTTVKVGAMTYTVEIVPGMFADHSEFGHVWYGTQTIRIAGDVPPERQFNAFIHELYHAIKFEAGEVDEQDERETRSISNVLTQVFVDNGWATGGGAE